MGLVVKKSLGLRARNIAIKRGIPKSTVETIIKDYILSLIEDGERGDRIVIDGVTSITMVRDLDTGDIVPRGRVSPALKSRLQSVNLPSSFVE